MTFDPHEIAGFALRRRELWAGLAALRTPDGILMDQSPALVVAER